jgi:hypothetical protein
MVVYLLGAVRVIDTGCYDVSVAGNHDTHSYTLSIVQHSKDIVIRISYTSTVTEISPGREPDIHRQFSFRTIGLLLSDQSLQSTTVS